MKKVLLSVIKWYKKNISLFFETKGIKCKYEPTCSEYAVEAIEKYGVLKGSFMAIKRLLRCNPFSKGGYDPVK